MNRDLDEERSLVMEEARPTDAGCRLSTFHRVRGYSGAGLKIDVFSSEFKTSID